jgi:cytochrome P450
MCATTNPARADAKVYETVRFWELSAFAGEDPPRLGAWVSRLGSTGRLRPTFRDGTFATLRRESPVSFHDSYISNGVSPVAGHWALTSYDDVFYASRHPEIFSSALGITIGDQNPELAEYFGSMIAMDDPRHSRLRNIVRSAFTPRVLALIEDSVRERARRLVATMVADHPYGKAELVTEFSGLFPLQIICDMMGIPEEDHQKIFHWTNVILGFGDPDIATDFEEFASVSMDIGAYATALADDRRENPGEDLTTSLVHAEVEGERLISSEVASFFILLWLRATRPPATRSAMACLRSAATPSSATTGGRATTRWLRQRSRKSCAGPRRWFTCAAPLLVTPS